MSGDTFQIIVTAGILYGVSCAMALTCMEDAEAAELFLWPLVAIKALLIGAYRIIFTGWRA